jgi:hypothetical protein
VGQALLFSTDINLEASEILSFYQSRFQIEFIFRDARACHQLTHLTLVNNYAVQTGLR